MRKVIVEVKVKMRIDMNEGVDVDEVIQELNYEFNSGHDGADIVDTEITDFEIKDS